MDHDSGNSVVLLTIGAALFAGYAAHVVGSRTHVPRVTLLLILGVLCGPSALDVVPPEAVSWFPLIAHFALAVVGFLLGEEFVAKRSRHNPRLLGWACIITVVTAAVVFVATWMAGASIELALILGGVATATAPAATLDTIREARCSGPLTEGTLGIVSADDILGVGLFSLLLAAAAVIGGAGSSLHEILLGFWEIAGAVLIGVVLGFPMAWITGRLRPGELALPEALGFLLLAAGLAELVGASFILAAMVLGGTVAWRAKHHRRAVHEIEGLSTPLLALFFLFAGFELKIGALAGVGIIASAYVVARVGGRLLGGTLGGRATGHSDIAGSMGWCLLAQAGVALGLALHAAKRMPALADELLSLVVAATVVFELCGPLLLRWQLQRRGETGRDPSAPT